MYTILADGITIHLGNNAWSFSTSFITYLVIAAIVGLIAEFIVGWRLPFGIIGSVVAGLVGIWLMTQVIIITGLPDWSYNGVQLVPALIGALILVSVWHMLTYRSWRSRGRYYRGSAN
jgi:uncharacterized membrane protein YeaQ/YmgE (transglycosylase-associated protein family)